jgi:hypothetical protein
MIPLMKAVLSNLISYSIIMYRHLVHLVPIPITANLETISSMKSFVDFVLPWVQEEYVQPSCQNCMCGQFWKFSYQLLGTQISLKCNDCDMRQGDLKSRKHCEKYDFHPN